MPKDKQGTANKCTIPSRAKYQDVILQTDKKKSRQQPPPASQHQSVLTLDNILGTLQGSLETTTTVVPAAGAPAQSSFPSPK
jgi:hypothetical protein